MSRRRTLLSLGWPSASRGLAALAVGIAMLALMLALGSLSASTTPASATSAPAVGTLVSTPVRSTAPDAGQFVQTYVRQYDPLPASFPGHPAACDWLGYLRFRAKNGPSDPQQADAVLITMPGN